MAKQRGKKSGRRKEKRVVPHGVAHILATFNNTLITIADPEGNVVAWSSAGRIGFKGSRKGTPFAAQVAGRNVGHSAKDLGMRTIDVEVKGPGDALQKNQRRWMQYFAQHGIPHRLARVTWSISLVAEHPSFLHRNDGFTSAPS